jgi:signal transduction histidine kinase
MLEYEVGDNAEAKDLVQRSQLAQDQLVHLFEEIRGYAGPIKLDITLSNIGEIWREAWQLLALQRRGRNAELKEELLCEDLSCSVDHFRLVQLFRNLLENSLAACADPVCITVVCQRLNNHDVHCLEVRVRDNGPGFNAEQRRRLFEPFYTTKTRGTGLGMPIAQRIAEMHQGSIVIGEEWNAGAELIITIPIR